MTCGFQGNEPENLLCGLSHRSQALLLHHHWFMEDRESWSLSLGLHWSRCHCSKESLCSGIGSTSFQRASENLFEQFIPAGAVPAMDSLLSNSLCVVWPFFPPGSRVSQTCTKNSINVGADWVAFCANQSPAWVFPTLALHSDVP